MRIKRLLLALLLLFVWLAPAGDVQAADEKHSIYEDLRFSVNGGAFRVVKTIHYKYENNRYVSMRDLAAALSGTEKTFELSVAETSVTITTGIPYQAAGGENEPFPGETDDCVPSPKGIAFDTKPELSLPELSKKVKGAVETGYDFILTNFVNGDVIGHTANSEAKIEACKVLGKYVDEVSRFAKEHGYFVAVTADHGNIETLYDKKGNPHVAHTSNLIPFLVVDPQGRDVLLRDGTMQDVAPTVLSVLGLSKPEVMTGESLITTPGITNPKMLLIICDGYGFGSADDNDAVWSADNPEWKKMLWTYPNCTLRAFGPYVGLQEGKPGNSEAGHINMGAGRVVPQDDVRMDNAIKDGSFKTNPVFMTSIRNAVEKNVPLHLICLLTKKSSHGCIDYPIMLTEMAKEAGVKETYLHIIFDGRSTEPGSAPELLKWLDEKLEEIGTGKIVDGIGRGIALDRDHNYEKTEKAYNNLVFGTGTAYRE